MTAVPAEKQAGPDPVPAPDASAREVFGSSLPQAKSYVAMLADAGVVRGLIGPREVPRLWARHLVNSALVADLLPAGSRVVDVGSGAGLPGIVLAIRRPDVTVDLVEPLLRRTRFLDEVVSTLELNRRVRVIRGRADDRSVVAEVGAPIGS